MLIRVNSFYGRLKVKLENFELIKFENDYFHLSISLIRHRGHKVPSKKHNVNNVLVIKLEKLCV